MPDDKGRVWLFKNTYAKTEKHPVMTGRGEVSKDVLAKLAEKADSEGVVELHAAAWDRTSAGGNKYLFLTFDLKEEGKGASDKGQRSREGGDDVPF
jgi:hypothetical protein